MSGANNGRGPDFLVIGAARAGSSSLAEGLKSHPDVFLTDPKEPHYFALSRRGADFTGPGDATTINKVAVTDRDAYLALYRDGQDAAARGDASVSTLYYHHESIPTIRELNPDMRLVVLLREPVSRAWSSHQYMIGRGQEPEPDFLTAVGLEEQRKAAGWHHIWHYTSMSRYAESLQAFVDAFGGDRLGIWFHDELERDFAGTISQILRFLDLPPARGEGEGVPRVNVSGQHRFPVLQKAIGVATANARLRGFVKEHTSFRLREQVRRTILRSDPIPAEARARLEPGFADDLAALRGLLAGHTGPHGQLPGWLEG